MANHLQWIELDGIVKNYLVQSEQGQNKFYKLYQIALIGMKSMGLDAFFPTITRKVPVNANKTVNLPEDYIAYKKIGVLNPNGEVATLKRNDDLTKYADGLPDRLDKNTDNTLVTNVIPDDSPFFYWNYWDGDYWTNLYGIPSGSVEFGSFTIDDAEGIIVLSNWFPFDYLIIEYLAFLKTNEKYYIPVQFEEAMIAYLRWQDIINQPSNRRANISEKQYRSHEYYNQKRLAKRRYSPIRLQEARDWISASQRMVVKS